MELTDYLRVARAYWRGIVAFVLLGVAVAAGVSLVTPKVYQADASGFVSAGTATNPGEASVGDSLAKSRATSYVDLAQSRATAQDVIKTLGLDAQPAGLIGRITVKQPLDTVLIKISARASTPKESQELADAWVAALARQVQAVENPTGKSEQALRIVPIESAALPSSPVSPNTKRNVALGFVLGLMLGLGYALLRSQLDRRVREPETVERDFGVTVAGAIPETSALVRKKGGLVPLVVTGPRKDKDPVHSAESFLKLRTNLQFMDIDNPPRIIVVTSPLPGDGKSTVAMNLAAALSMSDRRVILIDGDLRRPVIADSFGLIEGLGLTDVLIGSVQFDEVAQQVGGLPNLRVLAAGRVPPNPSEMLGSKAMRRLLERLGETCTVIIDAPPLLPVTDAAVLTASADGALVVVSAGQTLDTQLRDALANLAAVNGHTLGVVLNRVSPKSSSAGYYSGNYSTVQEQRPERSAASEPAGR
ncbi:polysaccharide biosynthesis tyrosine autokinase [Pedococcus cremeus]|uniref:polysaccharide biosynthesis tyrosine autokinase n=1 Tax=Pedococcus cremeus TaxID=587636 RepID=UPI0015A634BB|nr:polysaccharide biosynthesis tyrosine autokinase [Pedococcus cremeus]